MRHTIYNNICKARKQKGVKLKEPKRMGRPHSTNPQNIKVTIRLTKAEKEKLDNYCKNNDISISELFRRYLKKIK